MYKGASPPAVGWSLTDAVLLGSLHNYRLFFSRMTGTGQGTGKSLPTQYHALSGAMAGWTNSVVSIFSNVSIFASEPADTLTPGSSPLR